MGLCCLFSAFMNDRLERQLIRLYSGGAQGAPSRKAWEELQRELEFGHEYEMPKLPSGAALLVIDVQKGFDDAAWGTRSNPDAEKKIASLLSLWRASGRSVIHVQHMSRELHSPLRAGQAGSEFKEEARPLEGETVIQKSVNSSFIGTGLEAMLKERGIQTLVLAGFTANHCVSTTARMAGNLGFKTYVVSDATVAFARRGWDGKLYSAEQMHGIGLAELHGEFAEVINMEMLRRLI